MELLNDASIPEPTQEVPLVQQQLLRASSRPTDPVLQQHFDNVEQQGQAQRNALLLAARQQEVGALITNPTNQNRNRNNRGDSRQRRRGGRGSRNGRSGATSSQGAPPLHVPTVEETALNNQATVNAWNNSHRPDGTEAAYQPKEAEYYDFCNAVYGPQLHSQHQVVNTRELPSPSPAMLALYTVTGPKCLAFCFYQAHRDKRPSNEAAKFDVNDYTRVQNLYSCRQEGQEAPVPPKPIGDSQLRCYAAAVQSVWSNQKAQNANNLMWEGDIYGRDMKALMKMVRNRKPMIDHANAAEKITSEILPYMYMARLPDIEKYMWSRAVSANTRIVFAALRDGYTMKMTTQAILRGESLEKADLSDCFDLKIKTDEDHHPLHIDVLQVATGKGLLRSYPM
jgi:hypothetical protein